MSDIYVVVGFNKSCGRIQLFHSAFKAQQLTIFYFRGSKHCPVVRGSGSEFFIAQLDGRATGYVWEEQLFTP